MNKKAVLILFTIWWSLVLFYPAWAPAQEPSKINIAIKEFPPFVFKELKGFCIDLARIICEKNNLTPKFVRYENVPELLDAVANKEVHLAFSGITITAEREKRLDFSQPFFDAGLSIAIRADRGKKWTVLSTALLKLVGYSVLILFFALTIVAHIIWFIEKNDDEPKGFSTSYGRGILGAYWWAVVTMTTVGYGDKCPRKVAGRFIAAIWMIIGIMWFAGFTATLSSALTIDHIEQGSISGLSDLNNKHVAVIRGTTSEYFLHYHNVKLLLAENIDDLANLLKNETADAIVYDAPALLFLSKNDPSIQVVGDMFDKQRYGVVFPQNANHDLKEIFNIALIDMQKTGEYQKIYKKWF